MYIVTHYDNVNPKASICEIKSKNNAQPKNTIPEFTLQCLFNALKPIICTLIVNNSLFLALSNEN